MDTKSFAVYSALVYSIAASSAAVAATSSDEQPATAASSADQNPAGADQDSATPGADTNNSEGLGDIVVTARRQNESLQRAPAAITAVNGEQLEARGLTDIRALQVLLTNAGFERQNDFTQLFIRGIGQKQDSDYIDSGTAMYFNGMYVSRGFGASLGFFDLDTVQVLPGPQGTLYGRNALGGAVLVGAKRPTDESEGSALIEVGNYGTFHGTGVVNVPLSSTVSVRAAIDAERRDGYLSDGSDDLNAISGRLGVSFKPDDDFSAYVWGTVYSNRSRGQNTVVYPFGPDPWHVQTGSEPLATTGPDRAHQTGVAFGGQFDYHFGDLTLSYTPSYFDYSSDILTNVFFIAANDVNKEHQFSNELTLTNEDGSKFKWVLGAYQYYFYTYQSQLGVIPTAKEWSYAGFANGTYSVSDGLRLNAGLRYSIDRKTGEGVDVGFFPTHAPIAFDFRHTWHHLDWKVGVEADVGPRSLLYANVQTGYMEGTFATIPNSASFNNLIRPETMVAYTVGTKNRFFGNRLELNNEAFYYDLKDLQITQIFVPNLQVLANAPRVRIYGDEFKMTAQVTRNDQLTLSVGYLNAKYRRFVAPTAGFVPSADLKGEDLVFAPHWSINGDAQHRFDLNSGAYIIANASTHFVSGYWGDVYHQPDTHMGSFTKTDLSLTYHSQDDRWSLGIWAKNVENSAVYGAGGTFGPGLGFTYIQAPRTFGGRLSVKLGGHS